MVLSIPFPHPPPPLTKKNTGTGARDCRFVVFWGIAYLRVQNPTVGLWEDCKY